MPNILPNNANVKKTMPPRPVRPTFEKYVDPEGELSTKRFKFDLWYVKNKVLLYKITVGVLIAFSAIMFLYSILTFGSYLIFGIPADRMLSANSTSFSNYSNLNQLYSAVPLQILNVNVFPSGVQRFDFIAEVANLNPRFFVSFDYYFDLGGVISETKHGFILPGTVNLVSLLGYSSADFNGAANLVLANVKWQRISNREILAVESWQNERINFAVSDFTFTPRAYNSLEMPNAGAVRFKLKNASAYSFKATDFIVGLYQDGVLVGAAPLLIDKFNSLETKEVDIRVLAENFLVNEIKLFPQINIYDESVYLPPTR